MADQKKYRLENPEDLPQSLRGDVLRGTEGAQKKPFRQLKPMLATPGADPFDNQQWIFEIKLDGYRILASRHGDVQKLVSRNGKIYNDKYPPVAVELAVIDHDFIIDGEVVVLDGDGRSDFGALQNLNGDSIQRLFYYVFDLLWLDGYDLTGMPLTGRKELLKMLLPAHLQRIRYLDHIEARGKEFFARAKDLQLEGIMAKRKQSRYYQGRRSDEWIKLKTVKRQEVVIAGYTPPKGSRMYFGSLVMAVNDRGKLRYAGRVGTGFDDKRLKEIYRKMQPLKTEKAPVEGHGLKEVQWVMPELLAEVQFSEWTKTSVMRHPTFKGLRSDKSPREVKKEKTQVRWEKPDVKVNITHPEKLFWPEKKITKKDVFDYYRDIAPLILPFLKDRPQSLFRTPDGISGEGFFQKNVEGLVPVWVTTTRIESSSPGETKTYMLCQDEPSLLFMVNWGCVEINPWNAALPDTAHPDYVVFDLDPVDIGFDKVVEVAQEFRGLFDELGLPFYCKTSGGRGLHIYLPVIKKYTHEQIQQFAHLIEMIIHTRHNKITSFERSPSKRRGKIYLDYLQNGPGKTMASVYSLRPKKQAAISTPLLPEELTADLDPARFNLFTIRDRLHDKGDLWAGFFDRGADIGRVLGEIGK